MRTFEASLGKQGRKVFSDEAGLPEFESFSEVAMKQGFVAACVLAFAFAAYGQTASGDFGSFAKSGEPVKTVVQYLFPEQVTLPAGKLSTVALHFRIAPGLHINSHTPKDEYLIPTTFSIPDGMGVRLDGTVFPEGTETTLALAPATKLSVYSGDFVLQARLVASAGNHLVEAKLRYQACDNHACMPPKTIPVAIDVVGK
jgi:hypothetical protein